jgi:hypothetical protein
MDIIQDSKLELLDPCENCTHDFVVGQVAAIARRASVSSSLICSLFFKVSLRLDTYTRTSVSTCLALMSEKVTHLV